MTKAVRRLLALVVLLGALVAQIGLYDVGEDRHVTTARSYEMLEESDAHIGETVHIWVTVVAATESTLRVKVESAMWTVVGVERTARAGDVVQVQGTIRPDRTITAERVIVSDQRRRAVMFAVSALALVLVVAAVLRHWTVDLDRAAVVPRRSGGDDA